MKKQIIAIAVGSLFLLTLSVVGESDTINGSAPEPLFLPPMNTIRAGETISPASLPNTTFSLVQVSWNSPEANEICLISGENGVYYMGWNDYRDVAWSPGYVHLGFSYSIDGGNTWSENQILANKTPGDMHDCAGDPLIIPGTGDTVYYVLMEFNETEARNGLLDNSQLIIMKSDDHGQTWGREYLIWPYDVDKPWGDYYGGDVFVAWDNVSGYRTEFSHTIGGDISSWTSKIQLPGYNIYPYLAINETGAIFVATVHWSGTGWDQMAVSISTDGGNTFGTQTVAGYVGGNSWGDNPRSGPIPAMAVKGKDVYVIWASNDTYSQVYLSESHDGGSTWSSREVGDLTGTEYRYMYPSVAVDPAGKIHLEYYRMNNITKEINVIYRDYLNGTLGDELLVDSWINTNTFIGDYSSIMSDTGGDVGIGYTTENPTDNAMFAKLIPPIEVDINYGWNLISLPWQNTEANITDSLSGINWTRAMVYQNGEWYTYNKARTLKYNLGFPNLDNRVGIWVYAADNGTMCGPGTDIGTTNITLRKGWNLVGYPSYTVKNLSAALSGIPYDYVQTYNSTAGEIVTLTAGDLMLPGKGYWVHVTADCIWTVEW